MWRVFLVLPLAAFACHAITVSGDNPNAARFMAGAGTVVDGLDFDGVVKLTMGGGASLCSGALLSSGWDILTAAHCVSGTSPSGAAVYFESAEGKFTASVTSYAIHPSYTGAISVGNDIAVLRLSASAPIGIPRYGIYTGTDEVGPALQLAGYGRYGTGKSGAIYSSFDQRLRRHGENRFDATGTAFGYSSNILMGDFDNGIALNDAFARRGRPNLDTDIGADEVNIALGDSGGPTFLNGRIAGVHSFGLAFNGPTSGTTLSPPDYDSTLNSTYGEFFGDTRVSSFATWVYQNEVPEPATLLPVLAALAWLHRRRRA